VVEPGQTVWQRPIAQTCPAAQTLPQPPQFCGSLVVSAQLAPQAVAPAAQPHAPAAQIWRVPQVRPHAPQFAGSSVTAVHRPPQTGCAPEHTQAPA
jgi:hypothetical protein